MDWATKRRFIILLIIGIVVAAFFAVVFVSTFYKTPTCTDGIQNQGENGIDCSGPCSRLCTADEQPPIVLFTKVLRSSSGRTDIVALVENKNINAAAKNVPYSITLYGVKNSFIQKIDGAFDLPPRSTESIFIPGAYSGKQKVTSAFLEIAESAPEWFAVTGDPRIVPLVSNIKQSNSVSGPRIEAILTNPSTMQLSNVRVIVLVYNSQKNIIAASRTIIPVIQEQGQAVATFTWNNAFPSVPVLIEVIPIIPLP